MNRYKYILPENEIPKAWYNITPDLPLDYGSMLHPVTHQPVDRDFLLKIFPEKVVDEMECNERWIEIPKPVREIYKLWRPTPLCRAHRLERELDTPAHIYYKFEGASPVGSHKPNTAVPQAFYAKESGNIGMTTETGAGQWGSALAMACNFFDIDCHVYMVRVSYNQKPFRRLLMQNYGASVFESPSNQTEYGRKLLSQDSNHPGSLGIAISEAVEDAIVSEGKYKFALGSVLPQVLMHQSVIGLETLKQFEYTDEYPDVLIACAGAGSNFGGFTYPFLARKFAGKESPRFIAAEPKACPSLTGGRYTLDYQDSAKLTPLVKMYTVGHNFVPPSIHAGGLRYHGLAPSLCALYKNKDIEAVAVGQLDTFKAALKFARAEGITPAPESAHAVKVAIDEALKCKTEGISKVIAFNLSGHGLFDLKAYDAFLNGQLEDFDFPKREIENALKELT